MSPKIRLFGRETGLFLLLALGCMNIFGKGSVVLLFFGLFELFKVRFRVKLDADVIPVALLMVFIVIASLVYYSVNEMIKAFAFFFLYIAGRVGYQYAQEKDEYIKKSVFAVFLGFAVELFLMQMFNIGKQKPGVRTMYSIWTGELVSVTLLGLLTSVLIGYSFYIFFVERKKWNVLITLALLSNGMIISINTATRTPIILLFLVYILMGQIYLFDKKGVKAFRTVFAIILVMLCAAAVYAVNLFGIRTTIEGTALYKRMLSDGLSDSRFEIALDHLKVMFEHPWGGGKIQKMGIRGAHNYLQQCHDLYGIFAFFSLCLITVQFVRNFLRVLRIKRKKNIEFLLLSMYLSMGIQLMLEPVLTGYPILFWALLFVHGVSTEYLRDLSMGFSQKESSYDNCVPVQFHKSPSNSVL